MPTHFSALRHLFRIFVQAWSDPHVHILMVLAATLLGMGTVFFHFAEGWRWLDAFYFSAVTLSTVGYGDFHPVTSIGKLVTVAFVFVGAGVFVGIFAFVSRTAVASATTQPDGNKAGQDTP